MRNRFRLVEEVVTAVRAAVGEDYPILIKLNFDDFMDPGEGLTFPESIEMFKRLETVGVDIFEPSGTNESAGNGLKPSF